MNRYPIIEAVAMLDAGRSEDDVITDVKKLIAEGYSVNDANGQGGTALIFAVTRGGPRVAQFLIDQGADIHARNALGQDAADMAALYHADESQRVISSAIAAENQKALRRRAPRVNLGGPR